jgi:putative ABC transport system permease protein
MTASTPSPAASIEALVRDARHAFRGFRRARGFAASVILTLALGIGGNTAIFSVVDQVLLRPLPYPDDSRLVRIYETRLGGTGASPARYSNGVSPANWLDWQQQSRTIESMGVWFNTAATLTGVGEPARVNRQLVSWEFFQVLGVAPLLGRAISADDDRPDAPLVAVLSHALWQRRFAARRDMIGRSVMLDDTPVEVIGVMPASFRFIYQETDLWAPFRLDRNIPWRQAAGRFLDVVARVSPESAVPAAQTEMAAIARSLAAVHAMNKDMSVTLVPLREELTGQVQTSLVILYAAVGVLLAIACFNVANLLLARAAARRREIAIRTSLGAGRAPIIRQFLVESVLLAVAGGVLGIVLARWSLDALLAFAPADLLRVPELRVDWRVLVYALGVSVLTGLMIGLLPALSVARRSLVERVRERGYQVAHSPRLRQALVVSQVAMTVVLLCGAGVLIRTVVALNNAGNGVIRDGLLTLEISLPPVRYGPERRTVFFNEAVARLRGLPGALSAGAGNSLPIVGSPRGGTGFHRMGTPRPPTNEMPPTGVRVVGPGYFRTLGIPVRRGREFTEADQAPGAVPGFVVNEAFVEQYLRDVDPLTASLSVLMQRENPYRRVIGVVGDVSEGSIRGTARPMVYYSHQQMPEQVMTLFVRADRPAALADRAVEEIRAIDPSLAVTKVRTLDSALSESIARERLNALVSASFAASGLLLAALGVYGLLAFLVTERTKEIGIRLALGAPLSQVTRSVVARGFRLVASGAAIGVIGSLVLGRAIESVLFGVEAFDPMTYAAVLFLLLAAGVWASYVPARRAAAVEPLTALRQE